MKKWLIINQSEDGKTSTIDIEGTIGGDFDWWTGESSGVKKEDIKAELKQIGALKGDTIIVNINSYGGDVNHGFSIHDLLASNPAKKKVYINGMTASAATVIAMAGDEIHMSNNALFLPHRASSLYIGNANDIEAGVAELKKVDGMIANIYAKKTGKTVDEVLAQMDVNNGKGEWMTADEAKAFGFVTDTFEPSSIAAFHDQKILSRMGLPMVPKDKIKINNQENSIVTEMKKEIKSLFAEIKTALGIKNEETPTAYAPIDVETDKGTLHVEAPKEEGKISEGDYPTIDGVTAGEGDYTATDGAVITIGSDGIVTKVVSAAEEDNTEASEEMKNLKKEVEELKASVEAMKKEKETLEETYENELKEIKKNIKSTFTPPQDENRFKNGKGGKGKEEGETYKEKLKRLEEERNKK